MVFILYLHIGLPNLLRPICTQSPYQQQCALNKLPTALRLLSILNLHMVQVLQYTVPLLSLYYLEIMSTPLPISTPGCAYLLGFLLTLLALVDADLLVQLQYCNLDALHLSLHITNLVFLLSLVVEKCCELEKSQWCWIFENMCMLLG